MANLLIQSISNSPRRGWVVAQRDMDERVCEEGVHGERIGEVGTCTKNELKSLEGFFEK